MLQAAPIVDIRLIPFPDFRPLAARLPPCPSSREVLVPGWFAWRFEIRFDQRFSLFDQGVGLIDLAVFRLFDDQKLRLMGESFKDVFAKLSTGRDHPGGQLGKCLTGI